MYAAVGIFLGKMSLKGRVKTVPENHRGLRTYGDAALRKRRPLTRLWIPAGASYTGFTGKGVIKPGPKLNMFMHDIAIVSIADRTLNIKDMTIAVNQEKEPITVGQMAEKDTEKKDRVLQTLARLSLICHVADEKDNASNPFGVRIPYHDLIYNAIYGAEDLNAVTINTAGNTLRNILRQSNNPQDISHVELLQGVNASKWACGRDLYKNYGMLITMVPIQDIAETNASIDARAKLQSAGVIGDAITSFDLPALNRPSVREALSGQYDFASQTAQQMREIRQSSEQAGLYLGVERQF